MVHNLNLQLAIQTRGVKSGEAIASAFGGLANAVTNMYKARTSLALEDQAQRKVQAEHDAKAKKQELLSSLLGSPSVRVREEAEKQLLAMLAE